MKRFAIFFLLLLPQLALADSWRPRIREHFEFMKIDVDGQTFDYKGTHNTFNFWYEVPRKYSVGLAFGPILGSARIKDGQTSDFLGTKIHLLHLGVEGKYYPVDGNGGFLRGGLFASELDKSGADIRGWSVYAGAGYEFLFKGVGIALEAAYRQTELSQNVSVGTFTPSIGFHFYNLL